MTKMTSTKVLSRVIVEYQQKIDNSDSQIEKDAWDVVIQEILSLKKELENYRRNTIKVKECSFCEGSGNQRGTFIELRGSCVDCRGTGITVSK